jgi:hypothetical protein
MARRNKAKQLLSAVADAIEYEQTAEEARAELVDEGIDIDAFLSRMHDVMSGHRVTEVAPPKNTGGGGFVFEEEVCAWLMLCMLAGEPPLEPALGLISRLDFQARVDGWLLDDIVVTTVRGAELHRIALSVKSTSQFGSAAAPGDFVLTVWQQWIHIGSGIFDRSHDYLGLVTTTVPEPPRNALSGLLTKANAADAADFASRLATPGWANEGERRLFDSFKPPSALAYHVSNADFETTALVQRLRFLSFDFGIPNSESSKNALRLARDATSPGSAESLWEAVCAISKELRPKAGHIKRADLIERLSGNFRLAEHPDYRRDWTRLDAFSRENLDSFSHLIAGGIPLPRTGMIDRLEKHLGSNENVAVTGRSGVGKSCVVRILVDQCVSRAFWFDARAFDTMNFSAFETSLGLQHSLRDLFAAISDPSPVLVLDGLDRVFTDFGYATAAAVLRAARPDSRAPRWRILIPCQSQSWLEVSDRLRRAAFDVSWSVVEVEPIELAELTPVRQAIPKISRLLLRPEVANLMRNLKILDLVARRMQSGSEIDATAWVGEANVAHWFWDAEIDRGPDRIPRARFARDLAERQGDQLLASIPADAFAAAELATVKTLVADNLCVQIGGDRLTFAHDLFGDWARLRLLLNHQDDFTSYVVARQNSPLWHRAIRLYGLYFLEHVRDLAKWRTALVSVDNDVTRVVHDLLLDAPVFAVNPRSLLESILPTLLANDGALLRRLFTRFLAFATLPDTKRIAHALTLGFDDARARALFRYPHWPYWLGVIAFVHAHIPDIVPLASVEVANMLEMWLPSIHNVDWAMRPAADIAVALGREALRTCDGYGDRQWHEARRTMYRCALAAASVRPDDVADIALRASARRGIDFEAIKAAEAEEKRPRSQAFDLVFRAEGLTDPWPNGPLRRVDEDFAAVAIEQYSLVSLLHVRPRETREAVLACLIEEPQRRKWRTDFHDRSELNLQQFHWNPPFYTNGPFLELLQASFVDGLDVIVRLVDFATERELSYRSEEEEIRRAQVQEQKGIIDNEVIHTDDIEIEVTEKRRTFKGGARVFGWSAGGGNPPETIQAALMALERYFYLEIEGERDVEEKTLAVLRSTSSVAFLRVLIDVGKRLPSLFVTTLRGLLSVPELHEWDVFMTAQGRTWALFGAFDKGKAVIDEARAFHNLEHRKIAMRGLASWLIFMNSTMTDFFTRLVASWPAADPEDSSMAAQLRILLDPANWEDDVDADRRPIKVNRKFMERQSALMQARKQEQSATWRHLLPAQCRMILDDNKVLSDVELESLWTTWTEFRDSEQHDYSNSPGSGMGEEQDGPYGDGTPSDPDDESMFPDSNANAILGCVAVFIRHKEWIDRHPERLASCRQALEHVIENPPDRGMFDTAVNASTWTWQCFAADVLVMLCVRDTSDRDVRKRLGESVFAAQYAAVETLFKRAAELRETFGADFDALRRLAVEWSFVRPRYEFLVELEENARREGGGFPTGGFDDAARLKSAEALKKWVRERVGAFMDATLGAIPADWSECDPRHVFVELDKVRSLWRREPRPDLHLIKCAHSWGPLPEKARDTDERARWMNFGLAFLRAALPHPRPRRYRSDQEEIPYPDEDERWLLDHLAHTTLQSTKDEKPDLLWTPIMDLPDEGDHWVEVLVRHIHIHGLLPETTPSTYEATYRQTVTYALNRGHRWSPHDRVWDALVGIGDGAHEWWRDDHASLIERLRDVIDAWMRAVPQNGTRIGTFAYWLARPFAKSLRLGALSWLATLLVVDEEHEIYDAERSEDGVVPLLNSVWSQQEADLRRDNEAFSAFQTLLRWLVERQNPGGLELSGRIGRLA